MTNADEKIRRLLPENREEAIRLLANSYTETIYWHARRMTGVHEDAEDVLQETFIRIVRGIGQFKWESSLASWIYRISTNECLRLIESRKKTLTGGDVQSMANLLKATDYTDLSDELVVRLQAAILSLPPKQRMVFNLRYYDDLPYEQIAEITGSTVAASKMNYHHAKEKITKLMTEQIS